jgi:hypothetical protein
LQKSIRANEVDGRQAPSARADAQTSGWLAVIEWGSSGIQTTTARYRRIEENNGFTSSFCLKCH